MSVIVSVNIPEYKIKNKTLLSEVEFFIKPQELFVIIGRNGAGKSTLLKHLTAEIQNTAAQITIFNKNINEYKTSEIAKKRAVLTQSTSLNFAYEVLEVVLLGRLPHQKGSLPDKKDLEVALKCLELVGLSRYERRNYLTLSGGEQQRVHLARTLAQLLDNDVNEKLLILDEPTSSLDIAHQHQVLSLIKKLTKEISFSCIAVLHDLNLSAQYADRVLILDRGQKAALGVPTEVLTSEQLTQSFGHKIFVQTHPHLSCPLII